MTGPPDFIDVDTLITDDNRPSGATWPESSTLPQRAIKLILDAGISYYGQTGNEFAIRRALPFLEEDELVMVQRLVAQKPLKVVHGFAREGATFPTVALVLANETSAKSEMFLNDYATIGTDTFGDSGGSHANIYSVGFDTLLRLIVYAENPDVTLYWYELTKFILIQSRLILARLGIDIPTLAGGDLRPLPEFLPEVIYMRELRLSFRTRQTFAEEARLIDHLDAFVREAFTKQQLVVDTAFVGKSER